MKIRYQLKRFGAKLGRVGAASGIGVLGLSAASFATTSSLPTGAQDAFTTLGTNVSDLAAATWPLITAIVSAVVLMKLFKRFVNKA